MAEPDPVFGLMLTETFLRMGADELSVNPVGVLPLREVIRGIDLSKPPKDEARDDSI